MPGGDTLARTRAVFLASATISRTCAAREVVPAAGRDGTVEGLGTWRSPSTPCPAEASADCGAWFPKMAQEADSGEVHHVSITRWAHGFLSGPLLAFLCRHALSVAGCQRAREVSPAGPSRLSAASHESRGQVAAPPQGLLSWGPFVGRMLCVWTPVLRGQLGQVSGRWGPGRGVAGPLWAGALRGQWGARLAAPPGELAPMRHRSPRTSDARLGPSSHPGSKNACIGRAHTAGGGLPGSNPCSWQRGPGVCRIDVHFFFNRSDCSST